LDFSNTHTSFENKKYLQNLVCRGKEKHGQLLYFPDMVFISVMFVCMMNKHKNGCFLKVLPHPNLETWKQKWIITAEFFVYKDKRENMKIWDEDKMKRIGDSMKLCKERGNKIMVIPLIGEISLFSSHSNMLIYRMESNTVERFEPHGKNTYGTFNGVSEDIDDFLKTVIEERLTPYAGKLKYIPSYKTCPGKKGFQLLEGDDSGFCAMWSMFMAELVFMNPEKSTKELYDLIFRITKEDPLLLKYIITGFTSFGYDMVNKVLVNSGSNPIDESKKTKVLPTKKITEFILGRIIT
jgi:hypothetical protein